MRSSIANAVVHRMAGLALAAGVVCLAATGWGDDGAVEGVGGAMHAMRAHPSIVMQSETVDAVISAKGADVKCVFTFRNEGPATTVKMGFPEQGWGDIDYEHATGFSSFRSWVDGKPVPTRTEGGKVDRSAGSGWKRWRTKVVRFGAGQTRHVKVRYEEKLGEISGGERFFTYMLSTGASWKGKIGRAKLTVRFRDVPGYSTEDGGVLEGFRVVKAWRDFEPTYKDDFHIWFWPAAPPLIVNGKQLPYDLRTAPLPQIGFGDLLVPVRWLVRHIGGTLSWDPKSGSAILRRGLDEVTLLAHPSSSEQNGIPARMRHSRLVVSIADVSRAFGGSATLEHNPERVVVTLNP